MYSTVQIASDPRIPVGRSFCGFLVSCAAVETASKPMYAKKTAEAPRMMPEKPKRPGPSLGGMNGMPVLAMDEARADDDEQQHHDDLDEHDHRVEARRLLDADDQDDRGEHRDEHRRHVEDRAGAHELARDLVVGERRRRPRGRQVDVDEVAHERHDVARPADADRRRAHGVLEDQIPADGPGDELAHRRVRVGVRAAGDRDHRRHLGVAEPGERRRDAGDDERQHDRGARRWRPPRAR